MNYQELTELSREELEKRLREMRESYFQQREEVLTGKESNSSALAQMRRDIARIKTALAALGSNKQSA